MATATTSLRVYKPASGDTGWDSAVNLDLDILDSAIAGTTTISTTSGTVTLTNVDYTNDQAKKAVLYCNGVLVGNLIIVIPNASRLYRVINATSGAFTVTVKTSAGTAKGVTQGTAAELYCDGSNNILYASPMVVTGTGAPQSASGAAASSVSVTPTGNISSTDAQAALAELQGDIDTLTTSVSNKQPLDSDLTTLAALSTAKGNSIIGNGTAWTAVTIGTNGLVMRAASGQSSGVEWAAGAPTGTVGLFYQAAAPTGWTIGGATVNDKALRVHNSSGGTAGGTTAFSTVFTARTIAQANLPNVNFTVTDPGHVHATSKPGTNGANNGSGAGITSMAAFGDTSSATTGITVSSGGSGTALDFAVAYLNLITASAN